MHSTTNELLQNYGRIQMFTSGQSNILETQLQDWKVSIPEEVCLKKKVW